MYQGTVRRFRRFRIAFCFAWVCGAAGCFPLYPSEYPDLYDEDGDGFCADGRRCVDRGLTPGDCDDSHAATHPGGEEVCDGRDNDCDGELPSDEVDSDGDQAPLCRDCDDSDSARSPDHVEVCDGLDNDCDGDVPAEESDGDADGFRPCSGDCDDAAAASHPGSEEICDGLDNDCDALLLATRIDEPSPDSDASFEANLGANVVQVTSRTRLLAIEALLVVDEPATLSFAVYESEQRFGDFEVVDSVSVETEGSADEAWYSSEGLEVDLERGRFYALAVHADSAVVWRPSSQDPPVAQQPYGGLVGGLTVTDSPTLPQALAVSEGDSGLLSLAFLASQDIDGDGDGSAACEDCDDTDSESHPGANDLPYDGVDQDCDGWNDDDRDRDGYAAVEHGGRDCDDGDWRRRPYAHEVLGDVLDNDCDGRTDLEDGDVYGELALLPPPGRALGLDGWSFPFCDTEYTEVQVLEGGSLSVGGAVDWSSDDAASFLASPVISAVGGVGPWEAGSVEFFDHGDALGVYWRDVSSGDGEPASTFGLVLESTGRILLDYATVGLDSAFVGWSCGLGEGDAVDLFGDVPSSQTGIGQGTESALYQPNANSSDLEGRVFAFCGAVGEDEDRDSWTVECGDPDDFDPLVGPP